MKELLTEKEYLDTLLNYKVKKIKWTQKNKKDEISLLDLNKFISQYFILKYSKKLLNLEPDFFLTTPRKDFVFSTIPNFNEEVFPVKIFLKDFFINWNLNESIKKLEIIIYKEKILKKQINYIKNAFDPIKEVFQFNSHSKQEDFFSFISKIKEYLKKEPMIGEYLVDKSNYEKIIFAINNPIRRRIISIVYNNKNIKAEEIRKKINSNQKRKYCLANIIKHLDVLTKTKIVIKTKRGYQISTNRIVFNVPLSWF